MKKKSSLETSIMQWAYQNRKTKTKTSEVLKSIEASRENVGRCED